MSMLVPDFWAEGRAQSRTRERQITVRRFGWSTISQAEAQRMADERAQEALNRAVNGERLPRRDPKVPYNGAQGVPIREQVVSRHGKEVITRNSYGALCLNTPRVLIADVDCVATPQRGARMWWWALFIWVIASGWALWLPIGAQSRLIVLAVLVGLMLATILAIVVISVRRWLRRGRKEEDGGARSAALRRVEQFAATHPDWGLRIYQTPAGLRLIATHRTFSPDEPAVADFFAAVQADSVYVAMCRNQHCFRARLTGKPWRMGVHDRIVPRDAVWPVAADRMAEREAWLAAYDARAQSFAACRFDKALGQQLQSLEVAAVVELHDNAAQALKPGLPIA